MCSCPRGSMIFGSTPGSGQKEVRKSVPGRRGPSSEVTWRAGLAQLPVSHLPHWAHVFWDRGRQLLALPADWAKALRVLLPACSHTHPSFTAMATFHCPASCSF